MIVIKNMKIPSSCYDCPFAKNERTNDYGSFCECGILEDYETINLLEHSKSPNCPLVEQESILDKVRTEIKDRDDKVCQQFLIEDIDKEVHHTYRECLDIIDKYKAEIEPQESEDKE